MAQHSGPRQEAVGIGGVAATDGRLCHRNWTDHTAWPGTQKKKKKKNEEICDSGPDVQTGPQTHDFTKKLKKNRQS